MTTENRKTYKVLALDGGGFRGVMTAQILIDVEREIKETYNCTLHEYFDLVTGTSTGSIIAAGIALKKSATDILNLYKEKGKYIFPAKTRFRRKFRGLLTNRGLYSGLYDSEKGLGAVLKDEFGELPISCLAHDAPSTPVLLIPAYNLTQRYTPWFCSNNLKSEPLWYDEIPIWKICTCSSSAPTFFPPFQLHGKGKQINKNGTVDDISYDYFFTDGGIAVNNPALIGIAHALLAPYHENVGTSKMAVDLQNIAVLSIGTGRPNESFDGKRVAKWGAVKWVQQLPDLFMPAPNAVNASVCTQVIHHGDDTQAERVLRLDYALPDQEQYQTAPGYKHLREDPTFSDLFPTGFSKRFSMSFGDIDNPELFTAYRKFAQYYLDGKLRENDLARIHIGKEGLVPKKAIANFIAYNKY